jgi:ribosome biogenesis GTPase
MSETSYRILSSGSLGYSLFDSRDKSISLHKTRGRVTFSSGPLLIGDLVTLDEDGFIDRVFERHSLLKRPRLANAGLVFVLVSAKEPLFSSYLLDKFLSLINFSNIPSGIIITKADLLKKAELTRLRKRLSYYERLGYPTFFVNANDKTALDFPKLLLFLSGKTLAFVGQTGVGKSSLLNSIDPDFHRKVDTLDITSGRGRHTTKEVVLLPYQDGFLFDTAGFSELKLFEMKPIDLATFFPGFESNYGRCHFNNCLHLPSTKGCAILEEVEKGNLSSDSYANYVKIEEEVKANDVWKKKL